MSDQARLERSYRRLLWAYPRSYRRHRGVEILTTMMETANPDQVRASRSEAIHLLLSGLRHRLIPPGWFGKALAATVTLWAAVVLSGFGAYLVWESHELREPLGDPASVDALIGRTPANIAILTHRPLEFAYSYKSSGELQFLGSEGLVGARPVPDGQIRFYHEVGSAEAVLAATHERLRGDGWQTGAITRMDWCECELFWASRDGQLLRLSEADDNSTIVVNAYQAEPAGVREAAIIGFLAGLVLVWPLMTLLAHRLTRLPVQGRRLAIGVGLTVAVAAVANTVDNVLSMVPDPDTAGVLLAADLMYPLANQMNNPAALIVIGLGLTVIEAILQRKTDTAAVVGEA